MNLHLNSGVARAAALFLAISPMASCEEDLGTIGGSVVGSEPFVTGKEVFDVFAYNKNVEAVRTNKLPVYQLGTFNDPVYGKTEAFVTSQLTLGSPRPTFGLLSQAREDENVADDLVTTIDENETVTEVFLYIPYLTKEGNRDTDQDGVDDIFDDAPEDPENDSDNDGVPNRNETAGNTDPLDANSVDANGDGINDTDDTPIFPNTFAKRVELDSVYYNNRVYEDFSGEEISFNLKVERSTFFLRDFDPSANFQEAQAFYSSMEFSPAFTTDVLFDGPHTFSDMEILLPQEDDESTQNVDESQSFQKLAPGIRIPLDTEFFQDNLLDKEGSSELLSQANFNNFLRGLHLSLDAGSGNDFLMLFDLNAANITVSYTYNRYNNNGTADDLTDDTVDEIPRDYQLRFLVRNPQTRAVTGNAVNTFGNQAYPADIANALDNGENASRIYLKGGAGTVAKINLFEPVDGGQDLINEIKNNNWIVNEAHLIFYVDQNTLNGQTVEPPRLHLYNADTGAPLINPSKEQNNTEAPALFGSFLGYDGIIEKTAGRGVKYTVRITDHINNIIVRDSSNAVLGLTLLADVAGLNTAEAILAQEKANVPVSATYTPLGTVLFGPNVPPSDPDHDKRLQLEIFYTEID
ncbi:DUF4270 domain-containing protein [Maribacter sp. 2307ULW6-5]|uniref:DUF4270 domain-containing protein n=1 Tax=Maribacter sp. 2307ULW6-5 TaxID=3386275 RepID=UPI0039BD3AC9